MSATDFERCLKECIDKNEHFISHLDNLKAEIISHHYTCNSVKTVGTVAGATGTSILVASVMAIPFTGGLSLIGTAGGLALSVGGGATTVITDVVDSYTTKNTLKSIEDLVEGKQNLNNSLQKHFDLIQELKQQLVNNDIPHESAIFTILTGIANESIDQLDEVGPSSAVVRLFTNLSRVSHAEELLFQTSHLGLKGLEKIASKVLPALGISGQIGANTLKSLSRFATAFSVAMTVVDITLLIRDWNSNHPTIKVIDDLIDKLNDENQNLNEIHSLIDALKERVYYTVIDQTPIVGATDQFNLVAVHLLNNESYKCLDLLKCNYDIDYSFKDLKTLEKIALFLTKDTHAVMGFDKNQIESIINKQDKNVDQAVRDLAKNLLKNTENYKKIDLNSQECSTECSTTQGRPVINNQMTLLYHQIIDMFVRQTYKCGFTELTRISPESVVYNDFHSCLSTNIRDNIEEIIVANLPNNVCYINSNAIITDFILNNLRECAKTHMLTLFNTADGAQVQTTDQSTKIKSTVYLLNQFRVFVDEFALQYWLTHNGGSRHTFDETRGAVQEMLQNLHQKMSTWVIEIKQYHPNRLYPEL